MSIYATIYHIGLDQYYNINNPPDEDGLPPLEYLGSHRLPDDGERKGFVEVAAVPAHCRFYRENPEGRIEDEPEGLEPFVRLGVQVNFGEEGQTVVLDKDQVQRRRDSLTDWLEEQ